SRPARPTRSGAATAAAAAAAAGSDGDFDVASGAAPTGPVPMGPAPIGPAPMGPAPADVGPAPSAPDTSVASADMTDTGYARGGLVRQRGYQDGGEVTDDSDQARTGAAVEQQPFDHGRMLRDVLDYTRQQFGLSAPTGYQQDGRGYQEGGEVTDDQPDYS